MAVRLKMKLTEMRKYKIIIVINTYNRFTYLFTTTL